ncbi:hypothetical protein [Pelagicoccus sp. SDUM812002]|uniref:hypothetical protein n=1 Tax=Pelagicoccus sp. SDUM812002 TaxID=3041266 RepID=UPI00280CC51A|nr:hypothetical protein [Pelagicoccus sp. SDUM812002]MDQ8186642.1 hypothetical protein [Pelagicoccus sp. SDUM812002]
MHHALIRLRTQSRTVAAILIVITLQLLTVDVGAAGFQEPDGESYQTDDGTVPLVWGEIGVGPEPDRVYEVRRWSEGETESSLLVYEGEDTASFVSGLNEGKHIFRIRSKDRDGVYPEWGDESLEVTVDYIDMAIVWPLMGAGAVCFIVLILTIVLGRRAVERKEIA